MHRTRNTVGGVVSSVGARCLVSIFKQFPKLPVRLISIRIVPYYRVWVQSWVLAATLFDSPKMERLTPDGTVAESGTTAGPRPLMIQWM